MEEKKEIFRNKVLLLVFLFMFSILFVVAQEEDACSDGDDDCKIDKAYSCLNDKINDKDCENLSPEEKVFSLLATGKCSSDVRDDSRYESEIKYTSQAYLGGISGAKSFLEDMNRTSEGVDWFLEIESPLQTSCTVSYSSNTDVNINEDKTIDSVSGGSCLSISNNGYWVEISEDCFDEEFEISCDKQFLTTLLYQKQGGDTIYVSEKTSSASEEGKTKEKVSSLCFGENSCDYEGTLWAALAMSDKRDDVTPYIPYLVTFAEDNDNLIPESFLYFITGNLEFKNNLLGKQISNKWWVSKDDRYYGTAVALNALKYEEPLQKSDSINWLLNEAQEEDGCWESGNIRNTAFLLYSISSRASSGSSGGSADCEGSGFFCTSQINCPGQTLSSYSCSGAFVCCSESSSAQTCIEQSGEICNSNQICAGSNSLTSDAGDLSSGQVCCINGVCQEPQVTASNCELTGGECRVNKCNDGEEESFESCEFSSDICCVQGAQKETNYALIWILFILIVLTVLGIVFRERLRPYWFRIKSMIGKFRKSPGGTGKGPSSPGPRPPPSPSSGSLRRVYPPRHRKPQGSHSGRGEIDEVLKKLKEMGK